MARVSSAPEDAYHFKGTFADGWGEIVDAKALVFQYPPNKETGRQDPAGLFAELTIQRLLNGEGNRSAEQPEQVLLAIQRAGRDTGTLDTCHPGNYPDGNLESDPVDCGAELGSEGNTLFAVQDGFQLNDKTKWMSFCQSLQEKGFKPAILKRTYFPDLIGLRAFFKTETRKKFREDQTSDPTVFVVTEIRRYPYEAAAGKATAKRPAAASSKPDASTPTPTQTTTAATVKPNGATAVEPNAASAEELAAAVLADTLAPSQKGVTLPNLQQLKVRALLSVSKHKPVITPELKKDVQKQLQDEDWLVAVGTAAQLFTVSENGEIVFAS